MSHKGKFTDKKVSAMRDGSFHRREVVNQSRVETYKRNGSFDRTGRTPNYVLRQSPISESVLRNPYVPWALIFSGRYR